jgi:arylformamidase
MMLIDITRTLRPGVAVWPGDTPFELRSVLKLAEGASVNLSTLVVSAHTGTHADAPRHFTDEGPSLEALELAPYWGPAQVVSVAKARGPLTPADFAHADVGRAPRLLVKSGSSARDPGVFDRDIVYPSPELAAFLGERGVVLYGADAPSMDDVDSKDLPGHHALFRHGIAILENLDLSRAEDGLYELAALPLKVMGGDGSPVRAALRRLP